MTDTREHWSARSGFIIAAIGSAIGLGNIWRFPMSHMRMAVVRS